ncbi:Fuc2NAc and GlcNAc transferase [Singulisphaera sp. GP187]|uniref:UDP-N-acetylmuramyl pentapeptide phosphotransferase n=1 Tax=Singulisphaera sp. GP187 TaxID=1882752 RepID=UPI000927AEDB|nr:UDP-N-acetylmuramyl pentapeptide phosphotransferase [Singulisphaera sp. GP187]SIO55382.1 Fuc2NAc and GlcNAc transferase [Singulisphaera sp. GP187]
MESLLILVALLALIVSAVLAFPVRWLILRLGGIDRPNERSSHEAPTPRGGGLAIVLGTALVVAWFGVPGREAMVFGLCVAAVAAVSLVDDFRSLSFATRLVVQVGAAAVAIVGLDLPVGTIDMPSAAVRVPHVAGLVLAVAFVVAYSNFFNFMDGINGIAACQASLSALTLGLLLWQGGDAPGAVVAAAIGGAAAGFLPHNFPTARIFMGDVGSVTLGFALALLSMIAHERAGVPGPALLLVHGAFLFDAVFTLLKRAVRGENVLRPHREHNYQLLVRGGMSHRATTLIYFAMSAGCCLAGSLYGQAGTEGRWAALLVPLVALAILAVMAHRRGPAGPVVAVALGVQSGDPRDPAPQAAGEAGQ